MNEQTFSIEEWDEKHSRWPDFARCLEETAPEQSQFVLGDYARHLPCHLLVALKGDQVVGFLRFGIQPIGAEESYPALLFNGQVLTEAKIHAFAVRKQSRNQGIGRALQTRAIDLARELGCYQLVSHTSSENHANHHVKLSLGFATQPADKNSLYFLMPLKVANP